MAYPFSKTGKTASALPSRPKWEVADIFRLYGEQYLATHSVPTKQRAVMYDVEHCRKNGFGYHADICENCGEVDIGHNSCRNRHCPKCQGINQRKWVKARIKELLPVPYYHMVFTLPHRLFPVSLYNKALIYELLFSSASETILAFGKDPKRLDGEMGFYGLLHSWGQNLWHHIHTHFIVPGGALKADGTWNEAEYKGKFLFPYLALSEVFTGKFIEGLKQAYYDGKLTIPDDVEYLKDELEFDNWVNRLVSKKWVVYCKSPLKSAEDVVKYIGRYTHRVAISNYRLISIDNGEICFSYKDYKDKEVLWKEMTLEAPKFIQRFLWHVLPTGFHKIRHFGFLANGKKKAKLEHIRNLFASKGVDDAPASTDDESQEGFICKVCKKGILIPVYIVDRFGNYIVRNFSLLKFMPGFNTC